MAQRWRDATARAVGDALGSSGRSIVTSWTTVDVRASVPFAGAWRYARRIYGVKTLETCLAQRPDTWCGIGMKPSGIHCRLGAVVRWVLWNQHDDMAGETRAVQTRAFSAARTLDENYPAGIVAWVRHDMAGTQAGSEGPSVGCGKPTEPAQTLPILCVVDSSPAPRTARGPSRLARLLNEEESNRKRDQF